MEKRLDLMHSCIVALSRTLTDAGLEKVAAAMRLGLLEINIDMNDVEAHEESARFVETVVVHLRALNVEARIDRLPDCHNIGDNIHPYDLIVTNPDGSESLLPMRFRCICITSGQIVSTLHVVLG